ncbi:hypothetical protein JCM3774_001922 [Rhodotorula dairenensis]
MNVDRATFALSLLLGAVWSALVAPVGAHMTMWHKSMYGVGPGFAPLAGDQFSPIGPDIGNRNDWWFRGPAYRNLKPQNASVMELPVASSVDVEISCNAAWTSYGARTTDPDSELSACPENYGAYHAGHPDGPVEQDMLSGCALAVADKDDIEQVGWDDLVVFSVNHECVKQRVTPFEIPARMPACSGEKCICAWLWLANNGTGNFYMTGFDCKFTGVDPKNALPLLPPIDPVFCAPGNISCSPAVGAKRPLYAYNKPTNVVWQGNNDRPGYHASWSFPKNGAQEDIFDLSAAAPAVSNNVTPAWNTPTGKETASLHTGATGESLEPSGDLDTDLCTTLFCLFSARGRTSIVIQLVQARNRFFRYSRRRTWSNQPDKVTRSEQHPGRDARFTALHTSTPVSDRGIRPSQTRPGFEYISPRDYPAQ